MPIVDTDDLETKCYKCGGSGWITITDIPAQTIEHREKCDKCGGKGTLLTAVGKMLIPYYSEASMSKRILIVLFIISLLL